jgi:hypothetical protein
MNTNVAKPAKVAERGPIDCSIYDHGDFTRPWPALARAWIWRCSIWT